MPSDADASGKLNDEIYVADGDYIKDIEINDLRNRYTLTKGSTQKMVITPVVLADPPGPVLPASGCYFPFFLDFFWISFLFFFIYVVGAKAYTKRSCIATYPTSFASADLRCVISR